MSRPRRNVKFTLPVAKRYYDWKQASDTHSEALSRLMDEAGVPEVGIPDPSVYDNDEIVRATTDNGSRVHAHAVGERRPDGHHEAKPLCERRDATKWVVESVGDSIPVGHYDECSRCVRKMRDQQIEIDTS